LGPYFIHTPYIYIKDGEKNWLIDADTVLFDLTGRRACGFAFGHDANLCCFNYPEEVLLVRMELQCFGQHRGKQFVKTENRALVCVLGTSVDHHKNVVVYTALGHYTCFSDHSVAYTSGPQTMYELEAKGNAIQCLRPIIYNTSERLAFRILNSSGEYSDHYMRFPVLTITQKSVTTIAGNTLEWKCVYTPGAISE
jgi:hypothetical protein